MNICENGNIVSMLYPSDLQTAVADDYISMENYNHLTIVFFKGVTTAADDPTLTLVQAKTAAGGSVKDLLIVDKYYKKQGTLLSTNSDGGQFTLTTQTASNTIVGDADSAEEQALWVIEIEASELDCDGGFYFVQASIGDTGSNAHYGCILGILTEPRYGQESTPSPLA